MITLIYYLIPLLIMIRSINGNRVKNLDLKAENEVLALRNKLRCSAIVNYSLNKHPVYIQIDDLIAGSEKQFKNMGVWVLIYETATKRLLQPEPDSNSIDQTMQLKGDKDLKVFFEEYLSIRFNYLLKKDLFLFALTLIVRQTRINLSNKINKLIANIKKDFTNHLSVQC